MDFILPRDLHDALNSENRIYLCGNLTQPQSLKWISDLNNEAGMSLYHGFTADKPHFHTHAVEYNYVISGCSKLFLLDENSEYRFEAGSFFIIPPMTKYASKHMAGTQIIFFKSPGGNDKQLVSLDPFLEKWLSAWD